MITDKQIKLLTIVKEKAEKGADNDIKLLVTNFEKYGHFLYESIYKNKVKSNIASNIIESCKESDDFSLEAWVKDTIHSFTHHPYLVGRTTNKISNLEEIWKSEVLLDMCRVVENISNTN